LSTSEAGEDNIHLSGEHRKDEHNMENGKTKRMLLEETTHMLRGSGHRASTGLDGFSVRPRENTGIGFQSALLSDSENNQSCSTCIEKKWKRMFDTKSGTSRVGQRSGRHQ
jgi:hypothetical protein